MTTLYLPIFLWWIDEAGAMVPFIGVTGRTPPDIFEALLPHSDMLALGFKFPTFLVSVKRD